MAVWINNDLGAYTELRVQNVFSFAPGAAFTYVEWIRPRVVPSPASAGSMLCPNNSPGTVRPLVTKGNNGTNSLLTAAPYATPSHTESESGFAVDVPRFVAVTYQDNGASLASAARHYVGTLTTPVAEASYLYRIAPAGALPTGAAAVSDLWVAGYWNIYDLRDGDYSIVALFDRVLSVAELEDFRLNPRASVSGCTLFLNLDSTGTPTNEGTGSYTISVANLKTTANGDFPPPPSGGATHTSSLATAGALAAAFTGVVLAAGALTPAVAAAATLAGQRTAVGAYAAAAPAALGAAASRVAAGALDVEATLAAASDGQRAVSGALSLTAGLATHATGRAVRFGVLAPVGALTTVVGSAVDGGAIQTSAVAVSLGADLGVSAVRVVAGGLAGGVAMGGGLALVAVPQRVARGALPVAAALTVVVPSAAAPAVAVTIHIHAGRAILRPGLGAGVPAVLRALRPGPARLLPPVAASLTPDPSS